MKSFVDLYMCILTFLVQAWAQSLTPLEIEQWTKCKTENNVTEDIKEVMNGAVLESPEIKCMMACFLETNGVMKEGKLDKLGMEAWVTREFGHLLDLKVTLEDIYKECLAPFIYMEKCESASAFFSCGVKTRLLIKAAWQTSGIEWSDDEKQ